MDKTVKQEEPRGKVWDNFVSWKVNRAREDKSAHPSEPYTVRGFDRMLALKSELGPAVGYRMTLDK